MSFVFGRMNTHTSLVGRSESPISPSQTSAETAWTCYCPNSSSPRSMRTLCSSAHSRSPTSPVSSSTPRPSSQLGLAQLTSFWTFHMHNPRKHSSHRVHSAILCTDCIYAQSGRLRSAPPSGSPPFTGTVNATAFGKHCIEQPLIILSDAWSASSPPIPTCPRTSTVKSFCQALLVD